MCFMLRIMLIGIFISLREKSWDGGHFWLDGKANVSIAEGTLGGKMASEKIMPNRYPG